MTAAEIARLIYHGDHEIARRQIGRSTHSRVQAAAMGVEVALELATLRLRDGGDFDRRSYPDVLHGAALDVRDVLTAGAVRSRRDPGTRRDPG